MRSYLLLTWAHCAALTGWACAAQPVEVPVAQPTAQPTQPQTTHSPTEPTQQPPVAAGSVDTPVAAPPPACPEDMVDIGASCIDRYEAPNEQGKSPLVMVTADEAVAWCAERNKRLCTEGEWLRACQGPAGARYPYGAKYEEHHCNHDKTYRNPKWGVLASWPAAAAVAETDRLNQSEPSGARSTCGSQDGVFDLTGNVAEWVVKQKPHPEACKTEEQRGHRYVTQGCSWVKCFREPHEPACDYVNCAHASGFRSYDTGFRCCRDRVGTPRD